MGDLLQDRASTIEVLHELLRGYEQEWEEHGFDIESEVLYSCMFLLVSCLGGMQEFDVIWTDLAAL